MLARRLLILIAVLLGLTALAAGVSPRERTAREAVPGTPSQAADPSALEPAERTLSAQSSGQRITIREGETVVLTVESSTLDSVRFADFGIEPVEPDSPARFELLAEIPGEYDIELLEAGRSIGTLEIRPAEG